MTARRDLRIVGHQHESGVLRVAQLHQQVESRLSGAGIEPDLLDEAADRLLAAEGFAGGSLIERVEARLKG